MVKNPKESPPQSKNWNPFKVCLSLSWFTYHPSSSPPPSLHGSTVDDVAGVSAVVNLVLQWASPFQLSLSGQSQRNGRPNVA